MAASDVYTALNRAINAAKTIDLWQAAQDYAALKDLQAVLELFGITTSYVLTRASLSGDNTSVTLTASGQFAAAGAKPDGSYAVTATLTYTDGALFALTLRVVDSRPWSFVNFFPTLPASMRSGRDETGSKGIRWTTSYLIGSKPGYAVVVNSVSFSARNGKGERLQMSGFLPEFADPDISGKLGLLSPWPLRLSGSVVMPASGTDFPLMQLIAQGSSTNSFSGSTLPDVTGPAPLSVNALSLEISVSKLIKPILGNKGMSSLVFGGQFVIGGGLSGDIRTPLLKASTNWVFNAQFDPDTSSLTQGLKSLSGMFGVELPIPMDFPLLSEFHFAEVDAEFRNDEAVGKTPSFSLVTFGLTITSNRPWTPPVPFVTFKDVGIRWVWGSTRVINPKTNAMENSYLLTGSVFGSIQFGGDGSQPRLPSPHPSPVMAELLPRVQAEDGSVTIDISLSIPSLYISGSMRSGDYIPIGQAFAEYFGHGIPLVPENMNVTALSFSADPIGQVYAGQARILFGTPQAPKADQAWTIFQVGTVGISIQQLEMWVEARAGQVGGGISGVFFLKGAGAQAYTDPQLLMSAEYPVQGKDDPKGWQFAAHLYPGTSIDLTEMVARFIKGDPAYSPPDYVPHLLIDRLDATFTTGTGAYTFGGTASLRWNPTLFGTTLSINASASADIARIGTDKPITGKLSGNFAVNKIAIMVAMDIGVAEPTYLFKVLFGELWVQAITSWRGEQDKRHQVVSVQLGGVTLGDILEYLVNLAAPTLGFSLDSPWDLLKRVDLSRFVLTIDPQENVVEFVFNASVDLGVMRLDTVGARYRRGTGQGKVELILTGDFFGQSYSASDPLSWDVVSGTPPSVPGQGPSTVDLRFLGFGQRVSFAEGKTPETVAASVAALRTAMKKPEPGKNPVSGTGLVYAKDSQWLMGLDIGLIKMIDLGIIFNDPKLYGLSIALGGERAGSLAGLRFEILYKKITNDIGMYRIELRVPDAFRTLQLGAVSLTLGIIVIEIYTNGNFKIDLGFPYNRDYSRSFSLQASIFIGRGGFYFGILNGDTSTSVPRISNGNFSPVIELGVGLAAGVGREVSAGILAGGAYIQIEVIFQGVLAWFNATGSGSSSAKYFRAQGVLAIHGKVYGRVDFVVVSASVTLEAFAQAMVVFESYRPILLDFQVGVRAEASIKILFVRISFSFSVTLELSFTIGSAGQTPWILADGNSSNGSPRLNGNSRSQVWLSVPRHLQRRTLMRHAYTTRLRQRRVALGKNADDAYVLEWQPGKLVFASRQTAPLSMLPYITVGQVPADWSGKVPANATPQYRVAFLLYADTGMSPKARTAQETVERDSRLSSSEILSADLLVQGLLRYALYALPDGPGSLSDPVNAAQLALLAEQMSMPQTASAGFAMKQLATFFDTNLAFLVGGMPSGKWPDDKGVMLFPMPPGLSWTSTQAGDRDFSSYNTIGLDYLSGVSSILNAYFPVVGGADSAAGVQDTESFASFLFRDFFQMVTKAAVTEAQKQLTNASVSVTKTMSLADAAKTFSTASVPCVKEAGDTLQSVAARIGASVAELLFLNPGIDGVIAGTEVGALLNPAPLIGVSPDMLVQDNPGITLVKAAWSLGDVSRAVGTADTTLSSLCTLFNIADVTSLFTYLPPLGSGAWMLGKNPNLLQVGTQLSMPAQTFTPPTGAGFDQNQTAAAFFVRYADPDLSLSKLPGSPDMPAWYAQAIAILNPSLSAATNQGDQTVEIEPGVSLNVPVVYGDRSHKRSYVTLVGDTLHRIGCTLVLTQDAASLSVLPPLWTAFKNGVVASGSAFTIPAWPLAGQTNGIVIEEGDTAEVLVRRMIVHASFTSAQGWVYDWASVVPWLGVAKVLSPLAVVVLPGATISKDSTFTFQSLGDTYGLSLPDVAWRLQGNAGLLPDPTKLTVKQLPVMTVQAIEQGVLSSASFAGVVNQASQMLMSGLRLPALKTVDSKIVPDPQTPLPLYDLTGQQFTLPVNTDPAHGSDVALALTVTSHVDWLSFGSSFTVEPEHNLPLLSARHANLHAFNSRLTAPDGLQEGMVLFSSAGESDLQFSFTHQQVLDNAPATGLKLTTNPATAAAPVPMPLSGTVPNTYSFENPVPLQTPQSLPIPVQGQTLAGYATLWAFPQGLLQRVAAHASTPYEIFAGSQPGATQDNARALTSTTYGCQLSFRVRRMNDGSNRLLLLGVDTDQRALLLALRDEILHEPAATPSKAYLAIAPAPNSSQAQGLALLDNSVPCFLVKTNLSTDSQPQPDTLRKAKANDPAPVYYADFVKQLADFLLLLWEGSVVAGTGYYLGFGKDLPGSAFDGQGVATFTLLAIAGSQQAAAPDGRTLKAFNNCLLVAPGLDASIHSLYAEGSDASDLSEVALTPPGNAGFTLTLVVPQGDDPVSALQDRYNTLVFWCSDKQAPYTIAPAWTPALPKPSNGTSLQPWERQRLVRKARALGKADDAPAPYWAFEQVIPFYRFTTQPPLPATQGLPGEANDPYRGFSSATQYLQPTLTFCMSDLLGNHSQAPNDSKQGETTVNLGYTDPLIGLSQWPELTAYFEVLGTPGQASLAMQVTLKAVAALPGASQRGDAVAQAAQQQRDHYASIYYQLGQPGVSASLATSLRHVPSDPGQVIDVAPLWRYAGGAHAFTQTASQLTALTVAGISLGDVLHTYPVRYAELAAANGDVPLSGLFAAGSQVSMPVFLPFIAQRSLTDLYAQRPKGWPDPGSAAALFALPGNAGLPLATGVILQLPNAGTVPTGAAAATPALSALATQYHTDAGMLGTDNADLAMLAENNGVDPTKANMLSATFEQGDGTTLTVQVQVIAGKTDTLLGAQAKFATEGVNLSIAQIAAENADMAGLLKAGQNLRNTVYVAQVHDTAGNNGSGVTPQALGTANALTPGIFDDGALVQFGSVTLPLSDDTLALVAQRYGCPADLFLSGNATLVCADQLAVPGSFAWPTDLAAFNALRVPYIVRAHDELTTLCKGFTAYAGNTGVASVRDCVQANAHVPGTLAGQVTIHIQVPSGNVTITTPASESFADALAQAVVINPDTTLDQLADAIASLADALQTGALLLFAPARLENACKPSDIAGLYGVDAASFALANSATPGLVVPDVPLTLPKDDGSKTTVSVKTQVNDTFNTVIVRFSLKGVAADAGSIVLNNPDAAVFAKDALALLPPAPVREQVSLGNGGPYPETVFALNASLRFSRPAKLVHPDFDSNGPVGQVSASLAPHAQRDAEGNGSLNFGPFIRNLTKAIPKVRAGTARVADESSDLWCVDFSATGIAQVSLQPGVTFPKIAAMPRFFALAPLYDHLVTRQVGIQQLNDDGTLSDASVTTNFMAIDAEPWAQRFLSDMDRFLSGPMATTLYAQAALRDTLSGAIGNKQTLASGITAQLQGIFDYAGYMPNPDPNYNSGLQAARDGLTQRLLVNLASAYDTSVVAQYDTTSTTPWPGVDQAPVSLYGQAHLEDTATAVTFTAAKTGFDANRPFVSFFATVADPERHSSIRGNLAYAYSHTEFDISDAGVPAGYRASNWLSFVPLQDAVAKPDALAKTNPGALLAPVPLRTYPALPSIREQHAAPTYDTPDGLPQVALWTYTLTCTHEFAAQDSVGITTEFNLRQPLQRRQLVLDADLFSTLAQYVAVADQLWTLLDDSTRGANFVNAAKTFASLAASIASHWNIRLPQAQSDRSPEGDYIAGVSYAFNARVTYSQDGQSIESLSLTREQALPGPGKAWPVVQAVLSSGEAVDFEPQQMDPASSTVVYAPKGGVKVPALNQQTFRLAWRDIPVSAFQNARARMLAVRNDDLLYDPQHPENPHLPTSQAFLLKTAEVTATSIVTPLIERNLPQQITGATPQAALASAIQILFPAETLVARTSASWSVFYSFELAKSDGSLSDSLLSRVPVALYPNQPLDVAAQALAGAVQTWTSNHHPATAGGGWIFSVILYSGLEPSPRPLFSADLFYAMGG